LEVWRIYDGLSQKKRERKLKGEKEGGKNRVEGSESDSELMSERRHGSE